MNNQGKTVQRTGLVPKLSSRCSYSSGSVRRSSLFGVSSRTGSSLSKSDRNNKTHSKVSTLVRVLDNAGNDVTPLPLYHTGPEEKATRVFLDEVLSNSGADHLISTSSFISMHTSSSFRSGLFSLSFKASVSSETEDTLVPGQSPAPCEIPMEIDTVKQQVTEEMLDEVVDIWLTETDTISLLDIPSTLVSEDADDAESVKEANIHYAELCKNRLGTNTYVERATQTFSGALKDKQVQCSNIVMVDEGTLSSVWDICDSFCNRSKMPASVNSNRLQLSTLNTSKEERGENSSRCSSSASTVSSQLEVAVLGSTVTTEPDPKQILLSDSFQHSLLIMERNIVAEIFQPKLAAYRQLPPLEDCDSTAKPEMEEGSKKDEDSSLTPTLEELFTFSCDITNGCTITSMAWNRKNPDLLAVGYGDLDSRNHKPGLICCWSLKNPTWPERIFPCHNCVTSLDFSTSRPSQLAVGMFDGTVAIYNVQCQDTWACVASSSKCYRKHLHPVWRVVWTKQRMRLAVDEMAEALMCVSSDGRVTSWLLSGADLNSIDLIKLKRPDNIKDEPIGSEQMANNILSAMDPGLCIDFHPTNYGMYLVGTWDGLIHLCSSNTKDFLETYQAHLAPVNHVEWSPFSRDVFLSCSSDWTIHLWKQGHFTPVLSFASTHTTVYTARWSPKWPTVFAAINEQQLEIWDLNSNILSPAIVHYPAPGVKMTTLLFATGTDCVLAGDSDGQVTVCKLKNFNMGKDKQVNTLEDIIEPRIIL